MNYEKEISYLKKLNGIINDARTSFEDNLIKMLDDITLKLNCISITFDTIVVDDAYPKFCSDINGYVRSTALGGDFFCDDINNTIPIESLDIDSIMENIDIIIETAKPYKIED